MLPMMPPQGAGGRMPQSEAGAYQTMGQMLDGKTAQADVNYRPAEGGGAACAACSSFQAPNECMKVAGRVSPDGMCDEFSETEDGDVGDMELAEEG